MSLYQIEDLFGVNEGYAKLLIPGVIIYKQILEMTGAEMLWVPGIRLCDGIAADYAESVKCLKFTHNFDDDIIMVWESESGFFCGLLRSFMTVESLSAYASPVPADMT